MEGQLMDGPCELAQRGDVTAFRVQPGGDLWIVATGNTPTPCWDVQVELSPIDIHPSQYDLVACATSSVCLQQVTPYSAVGRFQYPANIESVKVQDADGVRDVPIEIVPDMAPQGAGPDGSVVGWSRAPINLEEAISRAAAQLPRPHPNVGVDMVIDDIWYTDGGIVGPVLHVRGRPRT
jgi:hypothetical protein